MAIYKKRSLVPVSETWDIEFLLKGKTIDQKIQSLANDADSLKEMLQTRLKDVVHFHKFMSRLEVFQQGATDLLYYFYLSCSVDTLSSLSTKRNEFLMKFQPYLNEFAALSAADIKNEQKIRSFLKDRRLAPWRHFYYGLFRNSNHVLPEEVAVYNSRISGAFTDNVELFRVLTDAEMKFANAIDGKNREHEVNSQTFEKLLTSGDRTLRKSAYFSYYGGWLSYKETLACMLCTHFLAGYSLSRARKYKDQIKESLNDYKVSPELIESLYAISKKNANLSKNFQIARRHFLAKKIGVRTSSVRPWDLNVVLVGFNKTYSVSDAIGMILNSVKVLGQDYSNMVKKAFDDR